MPTKPQAIIFDLDGTTVDTERMWAASSQQMLEPRGIVCSEQLTNKIHDAIHGLSPIQACTVLKDMFDLTESPEALALEKTQHVYELIRGNISFIPGFLAFFNRVNQLGIKTALVTNSNARFVELVDKEVDLKSLFNEHIYNPAQTGYRYKPLPDLYQYAAKQLGVSPAACIAIEDSAAGIASAVAAGIFCVGINTAHNGANLCKADFIVESYDQILSGLKLSPSL